MTAPLIHGTCVIVHGHGVLIVGASGSGKSDLALRLLDRGAELVGDDYLEAHVKDAALYLRPAPKLAGKLEVRHLGICDMPYRPEARIALVIRLDGTPQRLPDAAYETLLGIDLPRLCLNANEASAPIKVELALNQARISL